MEMRKTQASIRVRFYGPTNSRGARFIVTDDHENSRRLTVSFDYSGDPEIKAAQAWLDKYLNSEPIAEGTGIRATVSCGYNFNNDYYFSWSWN